MMEFEIIPIGFGREMAFLAAFPHAVDVGGKEALVAIAPNIVDTAQRLAPRDTGYLASSIDWEETDKGIRIFAEAPYAMYVEYGTSKMDAQPFMRPAVEMWVGNGSSDDYIANTIEKKAMEYSVGAGIATDALLMARAGSGLGNLFGGLLSIFGMALTATAGIMSMTF